MLYEPDTSRGYWITPNDFVYAGLGLGFRLDVFSREWFFEIYSSMTGLVLVYLISLFIYIVPFIVLQSFLGQFSTSSYISAFRLTPLFKGIGYVSLVLNICVVIFYSVFATVPLLYMFGSMLPIMPWSCEGFEKWATNLTKEEEINLCNLYVEEESQSFNQINLKAITHHLPSVLYFNNLFNDIDLLDYSDVSFHMSWQLIICAMLVWSIMILFTYKFFNTKCFGKIIRYTIWLLCSLLLILLIRFSFFPGAEHVYHRASRPIWRDILNGLINMPIYSLSAFGPGWGLFITLSSFNRFQTNIIKQSWLIGFGQLAILVGLDLLSRLTEQYIDELTDEKYYLVVDSMWIGYLSTASVISHMEWANMWSILFYLMLFLANMLLILIQLYTILITIFDEFVILRNHKFQVSLCLIAIIAIMSLYFTSNHGVTYIVALLTDTYITQMVLNLLLLFVVLWVYGAENFKRDIEFMLNRPVAKWIINFCKYITPWGLLIALIIGFYLVYIEHTLTNTVTTVLVIIFIIVPFFSIPGYAIFTMGQISGSFKTRFQYFCRPRNWQPIEQEHRQLYQDTMGDIGINYQLNMFSESEYS